MDYNIDAVERGGFQARNVAIVIRRDPGVSQIVTSRPGVGHQHEIVLGGVERIRQLALTRDPLVVKAPDDLEAHGEALYGAWLAGTSLNATSMGLHHKLCHILGGSFNLPHAEVHAVILPHAAAFNRDAAPEAMRIAARHLERAMPLVDYSISRRASERRAR